MDFELNAEERAFADEVERFLDENATPDVVDVSRENMAQIVDTPERRAFMKKLAERGWLGMTWPKEYGGQEKRRHLRVPPERGARAARRAADRQGRRHHRQDADPPRQREAEARVPAEDPPQRDRVRGRLQRAAGRLRRRHMQLKATTRRRRLEAQRPEDLDDVGALRRLVLGRRAHRRRRGQARRHQPLPRADEPPGLRGARDPDDRRRAHQRGLLRRRLRARRLPRRPARQRASSTSPRRSTSSASRCSRSRRSSRSSSELVDYVADRDEATASRCKRTRSCASASRSSRRSARSRACLGLRFVDAVDEARRSRRRSRRRSTSSIATELSQRVANAMVDVIGPGAQLRVYTKEAPMRGRAEIDLPLHGDRHDRRRRVGDPEEHHRAPQARAAEELLRASCPRCPPALDGIDGARPRRASGRRRAARASSPTTARAS